MPDAKVLVVAALAAMVVFGGVKVAHGVKKVAKGTAHAITHIVKHPVDSAKNGSIPPKQ